MSASYYVYYRIRPERTAQARDRVLALLDFVSAATGVRGRLLIKHGEPNLWMEVYEPVYSSKPPERSGDAFASTLERGVRELALHEVLAVGAARKLECFEELRCV